MGDEEAMNKHFSRVKGKKRAVSRNVFEADTTGGGGLGCAA